MITANGEVQTNEEAQVYVHDLDLFVMVQILDDTPADLSLGKLCEEHGYPGGRKLSLNCLFAGRNCNKFDLLSSPGNQFDNLTEGPGRDFANFSLVSLIRRWPPSRELSTELCWGCWEGTIFHKIMTVTALLFLN